MRILRMVVAIVLAISGSALAARPAAAAGEWYYATGCFSWGRATNIYSDINKVNLIGRFEWAWNARSGSSGYYRLTVVDEAPRDGIGFEARVDAGTASQSNVIPYSNVYHYNIYYAVRKWRAYVAGSSAGPWYPPTSCG
ncbi:hypothetical protein [Paractinoplanes lichenicola]|uniref:Uncharacterized protein n=1 Tax=Paractinoplanes lichenicola TaxID=2802976 RepID=A0ABS1VNY2_9ACTN|nr:hypothetical protein [Actinoplanes lichenicola]MBL7255839.1 hypothetical protein [Actinoplanes lichenicola]